MTVNIGELASLTIDNYSKTLADNVTNNNSLLMELKKKGNVMPASGGKRILQNIEYAENVTEKWYSGYEELDVSPSEVFDSAEYDWKQLAGTVSISGLESLQNSGKEAIHNLLKSRIKNCERTLTNTMASGVYSDGTGTGGKEIGGLQLLVADDPTTGTVGGIDRSAYSFWQNKILDASVEGAAVSATNIVGYMQKLFQRCTRNNDAPKFTVTDDVYFNFYYAALQAQQRFVDSSKADGGFQSLMFNGIPVYFDGGQGGSCPASHMYMLNTDYLFLRPHSDRNMVQLGGTRESVNQDATVRIVGWAGNMTMSNAALQGVMHE